MRACCVIAIPASTGSKTKRWISTTSGLLARPCGPTSASTAAIPSWRWRPPKAG